MNPPNRNPDSTHPGDTTQDNAAAEVEERAGKPNVEFDAGNDGVEIVDLVTPQPSPETIIDAGANGVQTIAALYGLPPPPSLETVFENPNSALPDGSDVPANLELTLGRNEFVEAEMERLSLAGSFQEPRRELQESRPSPPIEVRKDPPKIKKPSAAPLPHLQLHHPQQPPHLRRELQEPPPITPIRGVPVELSKTMIPPAVQQPQLRHHHPQQPPHLHRELQGPPPNTPTHEAPSKTKKPPAVQQPHLRHPNPQQLPQQHRISVVRYNTAQENATAKAGIPNVQSVAGATRVKTFAELFRIPPHPSLETISENPNNAPLVGSDVHTSKSPRPSTPLEVRKDSNKIQESPVVPPPQRRRRRRPQKQPQQHRQSVVRDNTAQENATAEAEAGAGYPNVQSDAGATRVEAFADLFRIPPHPSPDIISENPNNTRPDGSDVRTSKSPRQELQGPRPSTALEVRKDSNKIQKSRAAPPPQPRRRRPQQPRQQRRPTVVRSNNAQKNAAAEAEAGAGNSKTLQVRKESHKIKKPTAVPPLHLRRHPQQQPQQQRPPVEEIKSPFLQGAAGTTSNSASAFQGAVSPAAAKVASVQEIDDQELEADLSSLPPVDGGGAAAAGGLETDQEQENNVNAWYEIGDPPFGNPAYAEKPFEFPGMQSVSAEIPTPGNPSDNMEPQPQPREEEDTNK